MPLQFAGAGLPMSSDGFTKACDLLNVKAAEIWAVLAVETSGCGFLPDRRPQILFERHIFHKKTNGAFDSTAPDISNPTAGGYGPQGAHQYDRLAQAVQLNRQAALESTSWGIGQVMGFNAKIAGFPDAETMVQAMMQSEDAQIAGLCGFISSNKLDGPLRIHHWPDFALGYNGPDFAKNQYDSRLSSSFQKFSVGLLPDLTVRAAQLALIYLGFAPGEVDGTLGRMTRSAIAQFQQSQGVSASGDLDADTQAKLRSQAAVS